MSRPKALFVYVLVAVSLAWLAFLLVVYFGTTKRLTTELIGRSHANAHVDKLWFLSDGSFATMTDGVDVSVWQVEDQQLKSRVIFDLQKISRYIANQPIPRGDPFGSESRHARRLFYLDPAILPDVSRIVVYDRGFLASFPHDWNGNKEDIQITYLDPRNETYPPTALTASNDLIAMAYQDGTIVFRYRRSLEVAEAWIKDNNDVSTRPYVDNPSIMKFSRPYLYVVSIPDAKVTALDVSDLKKIRVGGVGSCPPTAKEDFSFEIYAGRMAFGNNSDNVYLSESSISSGYTPLTAYGTVKSFAFFDNDKLVVGGNFKHVYLLGQRELPYKLADAEQGVTALSSTSNRLAFAGQDGVSLFSYASKTVLSKIGWTIIYAYFSF